MPPTIERLIVSEIDGFLALVPERPCVEVDALAAKCVRSFDHLRAAPDADEVARRLATGLTPRQSQYLADWGYPYVFEEFRFHITLSARLNGQDLLAARKLAESHFAAIHGKPFTLRNFTLFIEAEPGGQFQVLEQFSVDTSIGAAFA